jgi:hypothetical protein
MTPITIYLTAAEVVTIRTWYEYSASDTLRFGGQPMPFPTEQLVLAKLVDHRSGPLQLTRSEVECIADWMERAVGHKYGTDRFLFGYEELLYRKIKDVTDAG